MLLRKINAGLSLLTTALLLYHAVSMACWMLSQGRIAGPSASLSRALAAPMVLHALISLGLMISTQADGGKSKGKTYPGMNRETIVQRVSGVLLLPFTALHIAGATGAMTPPPAVHAVVPVLFFAMSLAHTAISTGKALITLGIGGPKTFKVADRAIKALCATTLVADVIGFYLFVC